MIWYQKEIKCSDQPNGSTITLIGIYNGQISDEHMIVIKIDIQTDHNTVTKVLFQKTPSTFGSFEDPSNDDVLKKYSRQIMKFRDKIIQTPLQDILKW